MTLTIMAAELTSWSRKPSAVSGGFVSRALRCFGQLCSFPLACADNICRESCGNRRLCWNIAEATTQTAISAICSIRRLGYTYGNVSCQIHRINSVNFRYKISHPQKNRMKLDEETIWMVLLHNLMKFASLLASLFYNSSYQIVSSSNFILFFCGWLILYLKLTELILVRASTYRSTCRHTNTNTRLQEQEVCLCANTCFCTYWRGQIDTSRT